MIFSLRGRFCPTNGLLASMPLFSGWTPYVLLLTLLACFVFPSRSSALEGTLLTAVPVFDQALPALDGAARSPAPKAGSLTLIHFFATWCGPCKEELQSLDRLYADFDSRALNLVAIDVGEPEIRVRRFFATLPVRFPVLLDEDRRAMKAWDVPAFPTTFVIAPDGASVIRIEGDRDWNDPAIRARLAAMLDGIKLPQTPGKTGP